MEFPFFRIWIMFPNLREKTMHLLFREQLLDALLSFVKNIVSTTKDPCWLTVMPWIHFLNSECQSYDKPVFDVKHDQHRPVWWGVDKIEKELGFFKGKSSKWST